MNDDVVLRDVLSPEFVGVSEGDTLADTASVMAAEGVDRAVVLRGREPVGLVRAVDVLDRLSNGEAAGESTVDKVMSDPPPTIGVGERMRDAAAVLADADAWQALVVDGDDVAGVIDARDIVMAGLAAEPLDPARTATTPSFATESEEPAADEYSTQSICEICGSLTRDLADYNGQLVCTDCRGM